MNLATKIKEKKETIYQKAAKKFDTTYNYVFQIANDNNRGQRGKGKLIKEWLEQQIEDKK